MTIGDICKSIVVVSIAFMSLNGCAELLDGPFNKGENMVPSLLYANNGSGFVTYWDEDSKSYRTYDQTNNMLLPHAIFELEEGNQSNQNFIINGATVEPLTKLDERGMQLQREQGCVGCHKA